jgi:hypothetical protein
VHGLASPAYYGGNYVWHLSVTGAIVPVSDRRGTMLDTLMMGFMIIGVLASLMIALTLLLIVLNHPN